MVPNPADTTGTITVTLPSGWTANGASISGLAGSGGVGTRFDGSNVATITLSHAQVDPTTATLTLTVSGSGPTAAGQTASADVALNGAPRSTQTAAVQ